MFMLLNDHSFSMFKNLYKRIKNFQADNLVISYLFLVFFTIFFFLNEKKIIEQLQKNPDIS